MSNSCVFGCSICGRVPDVRDSGPFHRGGQDHSAQGHCSGTAVSHGEADLGPSVSRERIPGPGYENKCAAIFIVSAQDAQDGP